MPFTLEELEEMARFDASLEADFLLTEKEVAFSTNMDHVAIAESLFGAKLRQRQYREANKGKITEQKRQYRAKKKAEKEGNPNE